MPDGKITFSTALDNAGIQKDLKRAESEIRKYEETISKAMDAKLPLVKRLEELDRKIAQSKETLKLFKSDLSAAQRALMSGNESDRIAAGNQIPNLLKIIAGQEKEASSLKKQWASVNEEIRKYDNTIEKSTNSMQKAVSEATELNRKLNSPYSKMAGTMESAQKSAAKFKTRIWEIGKSALVFNLVSAGLRSAVSYMGKALQTNAEYTAQLAKLKGAILTAFQPIYEFVLPGLIAVLRVLTSIVHVVANVLSFFTGKSVSQYAKNAQTMNNQLSKEASAIGNVGSAAKEAKKQLMGFDEINKLESPDTGDDISTGGGSGGVSGITPDFSDFGTEEYKKKIDRLTAYLSGALLALGAILAFSGANIPLGIALMAAGAMGLVSVAAENWNAIEELLSGALGGIIALVSPFMLAIGAVLAFSGANIPLGIGLMIAGLAGMALTRNVTWGVMSQELKNEVTDIMAILGGSLLVLGVILAFSGVNIPIGIAMIAVGATSLVTAASLNWDAMKEELQGPVGGVTALISGALLAIGAVLAFTGVALPLGIALIALGAVGLAGTASINWNTIQDALRGPIGGVTALISTFLLVLGVVLCFTGVALPLGIALIAAGAVGLVSVTALNWNAIQDKMKEVWTGIKQWFSSSVSPYLTLSYWQDKFAAIGDGLKQSVKNGVNSAIDRFNEFISWINSAMSFSWGEVSLFGNTVIPAGSMQLLSIQHIPHLAQGAVIPPNREFMAVLGDQRSGNNIEAPENLIRKIVREETRGMSSRRVEELLERLISTVEGIEVGDETIGRAAARYNRVAERARGH